ncbi:hypothetical protein CRM22_011026 [Opisthorchis felineus]|uniref:Uncharacterized protein n=1 Tax=Opisthorchis felineus TaxID=147828 RepID=A0A4S2KEK2_OPIFE|nr:hypothetical protein CRM22_011026 [Opisthorchis felineus]
MQRSRQKNMSNQKGAPGKQIVKSSTKDGNIFPTDKDGNIIPGTYQTAVGEVRVKKIEPAKHYDVISLARAMNDNFAQQTKELFSLEVEAVHEAMNSATADRNRTVSHTPTEHR